MNEEHPVNCGFDTSGIHLLQRSKQQLVTDPFINHLHTYELHNNHPTMRTYLLRRDILFMFCDIYVFFFSICLTFLPLSFWATFVVMAVSSKSSIGWY